MISRFWFVGPNHPRTDPTGIGLFILETPFDITYSKLKIIVLGSYLDRLWYFTHLTSSASYWDAPIPSQIPSCACRVSFKTYEPPSFSKLKHWFFKETPVVQRFQGPVLDTNQKWPIYKCPITKKSHYINWANVSPWNCWLSPINQYKSPKKHPKICPHKFSRRLQTDPAAAWSPPVPPSRFFLARRHCKTSTSRRDDINVPLVKWLEETSNSFKLLGKAGLNSWKWVIFPYLTIFDQIYPFHLLSFQINLQAAEVEINGSASPSWATAAAPWAAVPPRSAAPCPAPSAAPRGRRWKQWRRLRGPSLALGRGSMPCYYGDSTRWHHRLPKNSKATTCTYILRQRPMHVDPHNMIIYVGILILPYEVK